MDFEKYVPMKRTSLDGKTWWCVYDAKKHRWCTSILFGKYKMKKDAQIAIDYQKERFS